MQRETIIVCSILKPIFCFNLILGSAGKGKPPTDASVTMTLDSEDFVKMFKGELKATNAFMSGKLKIKGDMMMAMKLEKLMKQLSSKL